MVYGCRPAPQNLITLLIDEALGQGRIALQSHPLSDRDYVAIEDVARLVVEIATRGSSRLYNVARGVNTTHRQIAEAIANQTDCEVGVDEKAPLSRFPAIDTSRIDREFGGARQDVIADIPQLVEAKKEQQR